MPKTQYQIKLNYDQAKAEIEKLESLARKTGLLEEDIINYHSMLKTCWDRGMTPDDGSFYKFIQTRQYQDMYMQFKEDLAYDAVLKEIVENTYKAEQEALDIVMKHI